MWFCNTVECNASQPDLAFLALSDGHDTIILEAWCGEERTRWIGDDAGVAPMHPEGDRVPGHQPGQVGREQPGPWVSAQYRRHAIHEGRMMGDNDNRQTVGRGFVQQARDLVTLAGMQGDFIAMGDGALPIGPANAFSGRLVRPEMQPGQQTVRPQGGPDEAHAGDHRRVPVQHGYIDPLCRLLQPIQAPGRRHAPGLVVAGDEHARPPTGQPGDRRNGLFRLSLPDRGHDTKVYFTYA